MPKVVKCRNCGEEFKVYPSQYDKNFRFCSLECRTQFYREKVQCDNCGKKFWKKRSAIEKTNHNFCCRDCFHEWNKKTHRKQVTCENCGKKISKRICEINGADHYFCSWDCYTEWARGENHPTYNSFKTRCDNCGKELIVPEHLREQKHHFCNKNCHGEWMSKHWVAENNPHYEEKTLTRICEYCGKTFQIPEAWVRKRGKNEGRFCSVQCRVKGLHPPTEPEKRITKIVSEFNLPFKYVGTGDKWIGGLNPDFIANNGEKKVIEVFGRYWHEEIEKVDWKRTESGRKEFFLNLGYETLILWDDELSELSDGAIALRIRRFVKS